MRRIAYSLTLIGIALSISCGDIVIGDEPITVVGDTIYAFVEDTDYLYIWWKDKSEGWHYPDNRISLVREYDEDITIHFEKEIDDEIVKIMVTTYEGTVYPIPLHRYYTGDDYSYSIHFSLDLRPETETTSTTSIPTAKSILSLVCISENVAVIELDNPVPVRGVQFTLNGAKPTEVRTTSRTEGFFAQYNEKNGTVVLVSLSGSKIAPGIGPIAEIICQAPCSVSCLSPVDCGPFYLVS